MATFFGERSDTRRKPYEPLRRGEAVLADAAHRRAEAANASRRSAVQPVPRASEAVALAAVDAWNDRATIASKAVASSLRFIEFVRAYMAAFGVGFATYLLLSALSSGHFNILEMLGAHLFAIVTAPFYALMLAPAVFGLYGWTRVVPASEATRIYLLGLMPGALLLLGLAMRPRSADLQMIGMALTAMASGLVAARAFNRSAAKIRAKRDAPAH
jgi:hypothetical protein